MFVPLKVQDGWSSIVSFSESVTFTFSSVGSTAITGSQLYISNSLKQNSIPQGPGPSREQELRADKQG